MFKSCEKKNYYYYRVAFIPLQKGILVFSTISFKIRGLCNKYHCSVSNELPIGTDFKSHYSLFLLKQID